MDMKNNKANFLVIKDTIRQAINAFDFGNHIPQNGNTKEENMALYICGWLDSAFENHKIMKEMGV